MLSDNGQRALMVKRLLLGFIVVLISGGLFWANRQFLAADNAYAGRDFMTLWSGGKAVLEDVNPYDDTAWIPLRDANGSLWNPNLQDPYPYWTAITFAPLALLNVTDAAAVWLTLTQLLTVLCIALVIVVYAGCPLAPLELGVIALGLFVSRWFVVLLFTGQLAIAFVFVLAAFLLLYKAERPFLAGLTLGLLMLKPNPFLLFAPLMGVWLIAHRRWHVVAGGLSGAAGLFAVSWIALPGWVADWADVRGKLDVTRQTPTVWGLGYEIAGLDQWALVGLLLAILVTLSLGALVLFKRDIHVADVVALGLAGSLLITPYAWIYEHALLWVPVALLYARLRAVQRAGWRAAALGLYVAIVVIVPWALFAFARTRELDTFSALTPLLIGGSYAASLVVTPAPVRDARPDALRVETDMRTTPV